MTPPIVLYTDFGWNGPYVGHMKARLCSEGYEGTIIDLQHDAPAFDPHCAGLLLAIHLSHLPEEAIIVAVIDPSVGTSRRAVAIQAANRWLIGPDNDLLEIALALHSVDTFHGFELSIPEEAAATFHGRDVFAPAAARIAQGYQPVGIPMELPRPDAPHIGPQVVYIDAYGNVMTTLAPQYLGMSHIVINGKALPVARTFADVPVGQAFCYLNSLGLVEIAVNQGHAAEAFNLHEGQPLLVG